MAEQWAVNSPVAGSSPVVHLFAPFEFSKNKQNANLTSIPILAGAPVVATIQRLDAGNCAASYWHRAPISEVVQIASVDPNSATCRAGKRVAFRLSREAATHGHIGIGSLPA
jgi:hypothetical protein